MTTILRAPPYRAGGEVRHRAVWLSGASPGWAGDPSAPRARTNVRPVVGDPAARRRVLVVDDDEGYRDALTAQLEMLHEATVESTADGEAALALVRLDGGFDLILLDVFLPGADGPTVYAEMRKSGVDCPIVLMSAHDTAELQARAESLGAPLFEKPVPNDALAQILSTSGGGEAS